MLKSVTMKMRALASTWLMVLFITLCKVMVQSFESDLRLAIQLKAIGEYLIVVPFSILQGGSNRRAYLHILKCVLSG